VRSHLFSRGIYPVDLLVYFPISTRAVPIRLIMGETFRFSRDRIAFLDVSPSRNRRESTHPSRTVRGPRRTQILHLFLPFLAPLVLLLLISFARYGPCPVPFYKKSLRELSPVPRCLRRSDRSLVPVLLPLIIFFTGNGRCAKRYPLPILLEARHG